MKKLYFVDYVENDGTVEQYGRATSDIEQAKSLFKEAVHAYHLDDFYEEDSITVENDDSESVRLRTLA